MPEVGEGLPFRQEPAVRDRKSASSCSGYCPFWFRPLSTFGLFLFPAFSRSSPRLPLPLSASASPPWCWQKHRLLAISMPVLWPQLHCPRSFAPPDYHLPPPKAPWLIHGD